MNCQEVIEFMQRYIDDDLNQQETSLMMDHVGQCPDCAAMLVRLQQLSSELTQLPRVVPRFSLVDAILPELDRLQAAQSEGELSKETNPESVQVPTRSSRPRRHVFRKLSGVIAAGVIAGLLLVSQPQNWFQPGGGSHNDAASELAPMAMQEEGVSSFRLKGETSEAADSTEKMKTSITSGDMNNKAAESDVPAVPSSESVSEASASAPAVSNEAPDSLREAEGKLGSARVDGEQEKLDTLNPNADVAEDGTMQYSVADQMSSIPAETSVSHDGKWRAIAIAAEGTIRVYKVEDESLWYQSDPRDGVISLLSWNEENKLLYYTYTNTEDQQIQYVFDVVNVTESIR
jgi:hypothetical protein